MKPNISIIIPVYNVETYLADCLDSILAQTFESFEVILVDDGSTDGSPAIAQKYADAHSEQIRYYRKENGGPGLARNFGISKAKGDYLMFVRSTAYDQENEPLYAGIQIINGDRFSLYVYETNGEH